MTVKFCSIRLLHLFSVAKFLVVIIGDAGLVPGPLWSPGFVLEHFGPVFVPNDSLVISDKHLLMLQSISKCYCGLTGGSPLFKCAVSFVACFFSEACEKCGRASPKIFSIEKKKQELLCSSSLLGEVEYFFLTRWCLSCLFFFSNICLW